MEYSKKHNAYQAVFHVSDTDRTYIHVHIADGNEYEHSVIRISVDNKRVYKHSIGPSLRGNTLRSILDEIIENRDQIIKDWNQLPMSGDLSWHYFDENGIDISDENYYPNY